MIDNELTGIALVTYNRYNYFKQVVLSLVANDYGGADYLVIVQDGDYYSQRQWDEIGVILDVQPIRYEIIIHSNNRGVASAKNTGLKKLLEWGVTHCFTLEDDILINNDDVVNQYISFAGKIGVKHLNFALHGEMNKGRKKYYLGVPVYPHCVGAWSYYHKDCFAIVGFFDERFINAFEHVYHTLLLSNVGLTFPFWLFPDHPNNDQLLKEIPGSIDNSSIRPRSDWQSNIRAAKELMIQETGKFLPPVPSFWSDKESLNKTITE